MVSSQSGTDRSREDTYERIYRVIHEELSHHTGGDGDWWGDREELAIHLADRVLHQVAIQMPLFNYAEEA